jgi:hypothetical protein
VVRTQLARRVEWRNLCYVGRNFFGINTRQQLASGCDVYVPAQGENEVRDQCASPSGLRGSPLIVDHVTVAVGLDESSGVTGVNWIEGGHEDAYLQATKQVSGWQLVYIGSTKGREAIDLIELFGSAGNSRIEVLSIRDAATLCRDLSDQEHEYERTTQQSTSGCTTNRLTVCRELRTMIQGHRARTARRPFAK